MRIKLGDLTKIKTGKLDANAASEDGQYPFFTCSKEPLRISTYSYDCESVLIAGNGDLNVKYYNGKFDAYQRTYIIENKDNGKLFMPYLYFFMEAYIEELRKQAVGGVIKYIKIGNLTDARIKLPSMNEQKAIAEILQRAKRVIELRKKEISKLDELINAQFVEMFGKCSHESVKAAEVCDFITKGSTPAIGEIVEERKEKDIPFLKVYNLSFTGEMLFDDNPQYISEKTHNSKLARSKVYPNDVLMNIVGPPLGKFALVTDEFKEWNINQAISIFRAKERILPRFLLYALMQPEVLETFVGQAVGIRQQNLSLEQCRNLKFPLPSLDEQKAFVAFAEQVDKSKIIVQKSLDEAQLLFDCIMQQCFK